MATARPGSNRRPHGTHLQFCLLLLALQEAQSCAYHFTGGFVQPGFNLVTNEGLEMGLSLRRHVLSAFAEPKVAPATGTIIGKKQLETWIHQMHQVIGVAGIAGAVIFRGSPTDGTSLARGAACAVLLPVANQVAECVRQGSMPTDEGKA